MKTLFLTVLSTIILASPILGYSQEGAYDGTQVLTDEEKIESDNYVHQGIADQKYNELCADEDSRGKYEDLCMNQQGAFGGKTGKTLEMMVPIASKAYSMLVSQGQLNYNLKEAGKPIYNGPGKGDNATTVTYDKKQKSYIEKSKGKKDVKISEKELKDNKDYDKETEEGQDYCGMMTMVSEMAAGAFQAAGQQQAQMHVENAEPQAKQVASMYALAETQENMAKVSTTQAAGFGATAACYTGLMLTNTVEADGKTIAKAGAAGLLGTFYLLKRKAHKERATLIREIAAKMPGAGDCNPVTDTTCFCAEPTSFGMDPANYTKYCVPSALGNRTGQNGAYVCVDQKGQLDQQCLCEKKKTCIDKLLTAGAIKIGLGASMMKNPLAGIAPLSNGFGTGALSDITRQNLAFAKKGLSKMGPPSDISGLALNEKQKGLARDLVKAGVPKYSAAGIASSPTSSGAVAALSNGFGSGPLSKIKPRRSAFYSKRKAKFKSGGKVKKSRSASASGNKAFRRRGSKRTKAVEILDFSQRAERSAADITRDSSKPIFDIITYRYKTSAWREFKDVMDKEIKEDQ